MRGRSTRFEELRVGPFEPKAEGLQEVQGGFARVLPNLLGLPARSVRRRTEKDRGEATLHFLQSLRLQLKRANAELLKPF